MRGRVAYSLVHRDTHEAGRYTDVGTILDVPATRRKWNVILSVLNLATED